MRNIMPLIFSINAVETLLSASWYYFLQSLGKWPQVTSSPGHHWSCTNAACKEMNRWQFPSCHKQIWLHEIAYNIWYTMIIYILYYSMLYYCMEYFQWGLWVVLPEKMRLLQIPLTFPSSVFFLLFSYLSYLFFNALCLVDIGHQYLLYLCNCLTVSFCKVFPTDFRLLWFNGKIISLL